MTPPNPTAESTPPTSIPRLLRNAALVFGGGMAGVALRAGLSQFGDSQWMSATLVMNALGAFALGVVTALALRGRMSARYRLLVGTGAIGGFTSYSALFVDVWSRVLDPHWSTLVIALISVVTGPVFAYLGWRLGAAGMRRNPLPTPPASRGTARSDPEHPTPGDQQERQ